MSVDLCGVNHIDLVNHKYEATIKLTASWTDPTLSAAEFPEGVADPSHWPKMVPYERPSESENKRWCPALHITNLIDAKTKEVWYTGGFQGPHAVRSSRSSRSHSYNRRAPAADRPTCPPTHPPPNSNACT